MTELINYMSMLMYISLKMESHGTVNLTIDS